MDETKLVDNIKKVVDEIFSQKEKADQMQKTQDALNDSAKVIEDLTTSLEEATTEAEKASTEAAEKIEAAKAESKEKDSKIEELTTELEAAQKKVEDLEKELSSTKESLEKIEKDRLVELRMRELEEAKVSSASDVEAQKAKIRELSDEEFASYKQDRVDLRKAIEKELEAAASTETTQEGNEVSGEEGTSTPPPNVDGQAGDSAAMNFETSSSNDITSKYAALGKAMAESFKSRADK